MNTVAAPTAPLYDIGWMAGLPRAIAPRRLTQTVRELDAPLYQLGFDGLAGTGTQVVSAGGAAAGTIVTGLLANTTWASAAGPIGAGIALAVGLIASLYAAHELRKKQAKDENSAMNVGVSGFDDDLKMIQQHLSAGQTDIPTALQGAQVALANYWAIVSPHIQPGRNGCASGSGCPSSVPDGKAYCRGNIGAVCCVGCGNLAPSIGGPSGVLAAIQGQSSSSGGKNTADIMEVYGSKYGGRTRAGYSLTFTAGAASGLTSVFGGSGGSSFALPLLAIAAIALLV